MLHVIGVKMIKKIIEVAREKLGRKETNPATKAAAVATTPLFMAPDDQSATLSRQNDPAQYGAWVYACIRQIADGVARVPFRLSRYSAENQSLVENGPLYRLLQNPHPLLSQFEFFELITGWLLTRGKVFILPLDSEGKVVNLRHSELFGMPPRIERLLVCPPDNFKKILTSGGELAGWRYRQSYKKEINLLPEEVIYIRFPSINDFTEGQSPLSAAILAATTDVAAAQFMKTIVTNNGECGLIVKTESPLTDEQREQLIAALHARRRGPGYADRPVIVESGIEIISPSLNSADLQFLENRKFNRQEICAVFGVPQEILGFTEDANRSVSETARLNFFENRIIPICKRIEAALSPLIKAYDEDLYGWFDFESTPIMQKRRLEMVGTAETLWRMGVPFNDINRVFDLGFPYYPWHDTGYLPDAVFPASSPAPQQRPSKKPNKPGAEF
jgi:HK97 family phage portal protein